MQHNDFNFMTCKTFLLECQSLDVIKWTHTNLEKAYAHFESTVNIFSQRFIENKKRN